MSYRDIYKDLPDGWFKAKDVGLTAASLNAMERRGLVIVDRTNSPMRYKAEENADEYAKIKEAVELVFNTDFIASVVFTHEENEVDYITDLSQRMSRLTFKTKFIFVRPKNGDPFEIILPQ